jgi:hypothetical protein
MHSAKRDTGVVHTSEQSLPRCFAWEPGVHQCEAALIFERIRVHVAKAREIDRELEAENAGDDLHDLRRGVLLLLLLDARRLGATVLRV